MAHSQLPDKLPGGSSEKPTQWDFRDHAETASNFPHIRAMVEHFETLMPSLQIEELITAEKAIFVIRRESTLEETRLQFLRRLEAVLMAEWKGEPAPDCFELPTEREFLSSVPRFR